MKVLLVNQSDTSGGAAKAAYRLFRGLLKIGVDANYLVLNRYTDELRVLTPWSKWEKANGFIRSRLEMADVNRYKSRQKVIFSTARPGLSIESHINQLKPDIVNLHWVNEGMFTLPSLPRIQAPVIWSLHDMWPFTGGCHYDQGCGKFKESCGRCPVLGSERAHDLSRSVWKRKQAAWRNKKDLTLVGLSTWMAAEAKVSSLFQGREVVNIPNGIDTDLYQPYDREFARQAFGLPLDKKLVMFGAMSGTSELRKGFALLKGGLQHLAGRNDLALVVFGSSRPVQGLPDGLPVYYPGKLNDDVSLALLYSAVDVTVVPSLQENLSNTIMESMACGTPVVGFDIGGNGDMILHRQTGYLAEAFSDADLGQGIIWATDNIDQDRLRRANREVVLSNFADQLIAQRHVQLYESLLGNARQPFTVSVSK